VRDFGIAFGLLLVIEGALYALFPDAMKRAIAAALAQPSSTLRILGVAIAAAGVGLVWLIKR
jgi:uncharacterized protein YjeT (DUF2065 family)